MPRTPILLFLLLSFAAQAQLPSKADTEKTDTASVTGIVVKADTGEPLKKASVVLSSDEREGRYEEHTDASGRFQIRNIRPGRYQLWASHDGYVSAMYGRKSSRRRAPLLVLEKGQELRDVMFRLQRAAVITGRVVDEDGEPVEGAEVAVLTYRGHGGKRQLASGQSASTNDLGDYRIFGLEPRKYYLSATPPNTGYSRMWVSLKIAEPSREGQDDTKDPPAVYPRTFYPGTTDSSQALPFELKAGDETRADFTVMPVRAFKIRGHVLGAAVKSGESIVVVLVAKNAGGEQQQAARIRADGSYVISDVLPGSYWLRVSGGFDFFNPMMQTGSKRSVEVTNNDLDGIDLVLPTGGRAELKGRLSVEGEAGPKLEQFIVSLVPAADDEEEAWPTPGHARANSDGSFSFQQVSPGTYNIAAGLMSNVGTRDYYVKSVRYGGRDVTDSGFKVGESSSPRLELVLSSATARIEGVVLDEKELPVAGATVVATPQTGGKVRRYNYRQATTDANGRFVFTRLRPAEYKLAALEDAESLDYSDPELLDNQKLLSVTASAQAGSTASLKLKLNPAADDSDQQ